MLKVGVDARLLSRPITGIGRYTHEMCRALSAMPDISLHVYSPAPISAEVAQGLESAKIRTLNWHNGFLRQLWSESYLPFWARKDNIDVFWGPAHRLPRFLPEKMARVVTIHDLVWKFSGETMRPLSRLLERYQMPAAIRIADRISADSNATAVAIQHEFGVTKDRMNVVPLAARLAESIPRYESLQALGIDYSFFLFVGTLEPRKNLERLLIAFSRLDESVKGKNLLVIAGGKGWGNINIAEIVSRLGLDKYVRLVGYVDDSTLSALYKYAQFLVMPSLYEGFGLPLIEAMAHGTPVLTSNNSSMLEIAGDGGLLIDPMDVDSIQQGLFKLLSDQDLRKKLSIQATRISALYNWDRSASKLISLFEEAIVMRKKMHKHSLLF